MADEMQLMEGLIKAIAEWHNCGWRAAKSHGQLHGVMSRSLASLLYRQGKCIPERQEPLASERDADGMYTLLKEAL